MEEIILIMKEIKLTLKWDSSASRCLRIMEINISHPITQCLSKRVVNKINKISAPEWTRKHQAKTPKKTRSKLKRIRKQRKAKTQNNLRRSSFLRNWSQLRAFIRLTIEERVRTSVRTLSARMERKLSDLAARKIWWETTNHMTMVARTSISIR